MLRFKVTQMFGPGISIRLACEHKSYFTIRHCLDNMPHATCLKNVGMATTKDLKSKCKWYIKEAAGRANSKLIRLIGNR